MSELSRDDLLDDLRAAVDRTRADLPPTCADLFDRLVAHYERATPFPSAPPKSQGFGPLDSDNHKEYMRDKRRWDAMERGRFIFDH